MIALWIILGIVVLAVIAGIVSYNRFVSQRNLIRNAWANIDTELRRRYDLIPNLVESVKGYAAHELANTEDRIQASRRFYNNNVQAYNARIKQFPSMVIARMGSFTEEQFFEVEEAIRQAGAPRVDFGQGGGTGAPATTPPAAGAPAEPAPPASDPGSFTP